MMEEWKMSRKDAKSAKGISHRAKEKKRKE